MGTSLTGTKPKDTYDSLIKVGDNGPISGTAKYLSDGLGNDLPISVSTSNVGIGLNNPAAKLVVSDSVSTAVLQVLRDGGTNGEFTISFPSQQATLNSQVSDMVFQTIGAERIRINANGLTFNGDTAAANALDDYEEGTFTATLKGSVSDPTTPVTTTGTYTKIGRQVSVTLSFVNVNTTGALGDVSVTGLPFSAAGNNVGSVMIYNFDMNTATAQNAYVAGTTLEFLGQKTNGTWQSLLHSAGTARYLFTSVTYFV